MLVKNSDMKYQAMTVKRLLSRVPSYQGRFCFPSILSPSPTSHSLPINYLMDGEIQQRIRTSSFTINYLHLDADKVLSAFGRFGRYQMVTYLITNSVHILFAINMMVMPFITEDPTFECEISEPHGVDWEYTIVDKCTVLDSNNWTLACTTIPGARYNYSSEKHNSLASEFNLVCDNYDSVEHGASIFMLGK
uniref:DUF4793 domain-containing protein n=1 Tax=Heterorhabditis bacteriophora TaxID=37862 RepID=A0A1I7X1N8_HETBA